MMVLMTMRQFCVSFEKKDDVLLLIGELGLGSSGCLATTQTTRSPGSNETDFGTSGSIAFDRRGLAEMLMVTTTVRMVNRIHRHTFDVWPVLATLGLPLVVRVSCLEDGFLVNATTSNNADHGTAGHGDRFLGTTGQLDASLSFIGVVRNDSAVGSGSASHHTAISLASLHVANDCTLGHLTDWHDVADSELSSAAAIDVLTGEETLRSDESGHDLAWTECVAKLHLGERSTTAWIVNNFSHNTADVSVTLTVVQRPEFGWTLVVLLPALEDSSSTLPLCQNDSSHGVLLCEIGRAHV